MELTQLRYFFVVAESQSISIAAKRLHVSQPSLSMTIKRLEDDLGVPLFDRIGGKIYLNRVGKRLLQNTSQILQQVDQMYEIATEQTNIATGEISFGISEAGLATHLIHTYLNQYPKLTFRQTIGFRELLCQQLETGELNFAVIKDLKPTKGIDYLPLIPEEIMALVSRDHPLASSPNHCVSARTLLDYPFVLNATDLSVEGEFHRLFEAYEREPDIKLISQESTVIRDAIRSGMGVGLISGILHSIQEKQSTDSILNYLVALHITDSNTKSMLGLSTLHGKFMPASAQHFYNFVKNYFLSLELL
jgi:LysR family transcriptional regulator, transcription activator of glutamate synthase operon